MYLQYVENLPTSTGAKAQMISFGTFVTDAHSMFGHRDGQKIWQPEVDKFLAQLGLPNAISFAQYSTLVKMAAPAKTNFAEINSIDGLPHGRENGKKDTKHELHNHRNRA